MSNCCNVEASCPQLLNHGSYSSCSICCLKPPPATFNAASESLRSSSSYSLVANSAAAHTSPTHLTFPFSPLTNLSAHLWPARPVHSCSSYRSRRSKSWSQSKRACRLVSCPRCDLGHCLRRGRALSRMSKCSAGSSGICGWTLTLCLLLEMLLACLLAAGGLGVRHLWREELVWGLVCVDWWYGVLWGGLLDLLNGVWLWNMKNSNVKGYKINDV